MRKNMISVTFGIVVGARRVGLSSSETVDLLEFSHTTSLEFTQNGMKNKKQTFLQEET